MCDADDYECQYIHRLDLVNNLYGPGTTLCWYLVAISCMASWTLHPQKRSSGSINADFIGVLMFPAVAACHLSSQLSSPDLRYFNPNGDNDFELSGLYMQHISNLQASNFITRSFLQISAPLLLISIHTRCLRRAALLLLVGLLCLIVEIYVYCSVSDWTWLHLNRESNLLILGRVHWFISVLSVPAVLLTCMAGFLAVLCVPRAGGNRARQLSGSPAEKILFTTVTVACYIFCYWVAVLGATTHTPMEMAYLIFDLFSPAPSEYKLDRSKEFRSLVGRNIFPASNTAIKDLDQVVAILGGATTLAFTIYGIVTKRFLKMKLESEARRREELGIELSALIASGAA